MADVIFICKKREKILDTGEVMLSESGVYNSALFCSDSLNKHGISAFVENVIDGNCINAVIYKHKPKSVIIEALWVVPEKIKELKNIHKDVKFIIRLHSDTPFIAGESIAMDWINRYLELDNTFISVNLDRMHITLCNLYPDKKSRFIYLPNCYSEITNTIWKPLDIQNNIIKIGCFGAIRLLKNQLNQAIAALMYCKENGYNLELHMNIERQEDVGATGVLKNLIGLFNYENPDKYKLVKHGWLPRSDFLMLISEMDVNLQCSMSETFNIVAADSVYMAVPVITTDEIFWNDTKAKSSIHVNDIKNTLSFLLDIHKFAPNSNDTIKFLDKYQKSSDIIWVNYFK